MKNHFGWGIILVIGSFLFITNDLHASEETKIYIDLWENTLYLIKDNEVINQFKVSPGTDGSPTPIGTFKIVEKSQDWGGGFGTRWLGLDVPWGKYGIHGTNKPWLIGERVSSGCIRMFNDDVEKLYLNVPIGTTVHIDGPITGVGDGEFKNLSLGSKGTLVQIVQQHLKAGKYYDGPINGIYNEATERAVKKFQRKHKLPVTGGITITEYNLLGILE